MHSFRCAVATGALLLYIGMDIKNVHILYSNAFIWFMRLLIRDLLYHVDLTRKRGSTRGLSCIGSP